MTKEMRHIRDYRLRVNGIRGFELTIPAYWAKLNNLKGGERLSIWQSNESQDLIIRIERN